MSAEEATDYGKSFSLEKVLDQAKWYHDDLEKGGWREVHKTEKSTFWMKTFPNEKIPLKFLMEFHLPISAEHCVEVLNPKNNHLRQKWDKSFADNEVLQEHPEVEGYLLYRQRKTRWPISDRDWVLFVTAAKRVDWYGKEAYLTPYLNAEHKSKPPNEGRCIRVICGGQFSIVMADEKDPDNACTVFCLSHNQYNGWIPSTRMKGFTVRAVVSAFSGLYSDVVEGYKQYFVDKEK